LISKGLEEGAFFDAVVVGSGFGGTIAALTLANYFKGSNKRVCLLERGQWWISPELTSTMPRDSGVPTNMREFLEDDRQPFNFWSRPDNVEGVIDLASKIREVNRAGLYDIRPLADNVTVVCASGVGGGSLVYSNVTLKPHRSVYKDWPTESLKGSIADYFDPARVFIGVNRITTVAGMGKGNTKLEKSKIFEDAADRLRRKGKVINELEDPKDPDFGFALDLAITDVPDGAFGHLLPYQLAQLSPEDRRKALQEVVRQQNQQNVCERQGRCVLGCLPGARHTLNKKIVGALRDAMLKDVLSIQALCEAQRVDFLDPDEYRIHYVRHSTDGSPPTTGTIRTQRLVLTAGTLGTTELLLRSQTPHFPLSSKLGRHFSTDGDLLGFMRFATKKVDSTRGPINTTHAMFGTPDRFRYSIEDTTIPKMVAPLFATFMDVAYWGRKHVGVFKRLGFALRVSFRFKIRGRRFLLLKVAFRGINFKQVMSLLSRWYHSAFVQRTLARLATAKDIADPWRDIRNDSSAKFAARILEWITRDHKNPFASPEERLSRYYVFSCMGIDNADGRLRLVDDVPGGRLELEYSMEGNRKIFGEIVAGMKLLADELEEGGSKRVVAPTWDSISPSNSILYVLHPLGGCRMGTTGMDGVVNSYGQVLRGEGTDAYPNLYVMDGSMVPSALGVNSSLTIAALALRCIEHMIDEEEKVKEPAKRKPGRQFWPDGNIIEQMTDPDAPQTL